MPVRLGIERLIDGPAFARVSGVAGVAVAAGSLEWLAEVVEQEGAAAVGQIGVLAHHLDARLGELA